MKEIEINILEILNRDENILDDEEAVEILNQSKKLANDIEDK